MGFITINNFAGKSSIVIKQPIGENSTWIMMYYLQYLWYIIEFGKKANVNPYLKNITLHIEE